MTEQTDDGASERSGAVVDEQDRHRFVLVEDGIEAQLVYRVRDGRIILEHTEVPEEIGGRGLGGRLVRAALERASAEGLTVAPWCPYARRWIEKHPDEAGSVAVDWSAPPSGSG